MDFLCIKTKGSSFDLPYTLKMLGHRVKFLDHIQPDPVHPSQEHIPIIASAIEDCRPDYIVSYQFDPLISAAAREKGIPYVSWVYDSPLMSLFTPELDHDTNYVFIFDKTEYARIKRNIFHAHIHYLPMSVNLARSGQINITEEDIRKYTCDISFVGQLYSDNAYNRYIQGLDRAAHDEINAYLLSHIRSWTAPKYWPSLSDEAAADVKRTVNSPNDFLMSDNEYYGLLMLTRKLAEMDRVTLLNALAEHYPVQLYGSSSPHLVNVTTHGHVDYYTEMNKIFYCSRINLNITLPSIETGLPQRIFDIMGNGGFVMTNYQEEIDDLFRIGYDIEAFRTTEELLEKTAWYLSHEDARLRLSLNGYKTVRDNHTHIHRMKELLRIVKQE